MNFPAPTPLPSQSVNATPLRSRNLHLAKARHDLRTPINHILGYCEMLQDEPPDPSWQNLASDLQKILNAGKQVLSLVNYYFDPEEVKPANPDLRQVQHESRTPLNHIIGYSEILQEQALEFGRKVVHSDLGKIRAAALVLLDLIETYLIHGKPESQADTSQNESIWPVISTTSPLPDASASPAWNNATILVVDDDPLNRDMLERRLRRQGCKPILAESGAQALHLVRAHAIDLILLDMVMPAMDGFQVIGQLKSDPLRAQIPVIMLSASDEAATAVHCIKVGADDFLPKPCNTTLLLARIESSLAKKRLRELHRADSGYFHDKGTLRPDSPSYVERQADCELLESLLQREWCYVLTSRQMGKSSLMVRTAHKLRDSGVSVVVIDLTAVGQNVTPEQWYDGLLSRIGRALRLEDEFEDFWSRHERLGPVQRLFTAIREVALKHHPRPLAIFVDEVDAVRSLPFKTDEFFAAIRECYNQRAEDAELSRLSFCLLGVANPGDLVRDAQATPFNIARKIELTDFTPEEASVLADGLGRDPELGRELLGRIFHWTKGHPYLTQRLCRSLAAEKEICQTKQVDALCRRLFLTPKAREEDDNLAFVRRWLLSTEVDRSKLLSVYSDIRGRLKRIKHDEANPILSTLRLAGIVRLENDYLTVRNRIYARAFDAQWVKEQLG
jgi:DNA-binding response OmpR family regulator